MNKTRERRSLLEKYDILVENLSFEYINECKNPTELERIVLILRSGEEGHYPELTRHAEDRLRSCKPNSMVLRLIEPLVHRNFMDQDQLQALDADINDWTHQMQLRENDLDVGKTLNINEPVVQPDIRKDKDVKSSKISNNGKKEKRITSCDYSAWDQYDVDVELDKIDLREWQRQAEIKKIQQAQKSKQENMKKMSTEVLANKVNLTATESAVLAEREREKGNEALKAGDYEEALHFYNSSLAIHPSMHGYNNRALTHIKLRKYENTVQDCEKVLQFDSENVKGLLRRAFAYTHLKKPEKALMDYEAVLEIDAMNGDAIKALAKLRCPSAAKKVRIKITDVTDDINKNINGNEGVKIEEISSDSNGSGSFEICLCDRAPSTSTNLRPPPHRKSDFCKDNQIKFNYNHQKNSFKAPIIFNSAEKSSLLIKPSNVIIEELPDNHPAEKNHKKLVDPPKKCLVSEKSVQPTIESIDTCLVEFNRRIENSYEFICAWNLIKIDPNLQKHAQLLRCLNPETLPQVLGSMLDAEIFSTIISCLSTHFCNSNDIILLQDLLESLSKLNRFSIIILFLNTADKNGLDKVFTFLKKEHVPKYEKLYKKYYLH